jgi:hypothetical protein
MGWIRLDRKIADNWLWEEKPFSRGQAWIDLILMANHKDNKFPFGDEIITVVRGDFITSELKLMVRWGWSKSRVRLFLTQLQNDAMIVKKSDHKKTTITIVNYSVYQDIETTEKPVKDHKRTSDRPVKDTNNKETKKQRNNIKTYSENLSLNQAVLDFIDFRKSMEIKSPLTEHGIDLLIGKLNKFSSDPMIQIAILNQSIMSGWKGVFPLKDDAQQINPQPKQTNKQLQYPQRTYTAQDYVNLEKQLINKGL